MDSTRTATISVALSTDLYLTMSFIFNGELIINDETVLGGAGYEEIYTCDTLTAEILQSVTSWSQFRVFDCDMNAAMLNPFYYCMATSSHRASDGY